MAHPRKTYVLDTSVLLSSPRAMFTFAEHHVVLPLVVIKELEAKRGDADLGWSARTALQALEGLRTRGDGDLRTGVPVNAQGGTVRIEINHVDQSGLPAALRSDRTHDTRILAVAQNLRRDANPVIVVSKDLPMRLLAETLGLYAEEYRNEQVVVDEAWAGVAEAEVPARVIDRLYRHPQVHLTDLVDEAGDLADLTGLPVNTGLHLVGPGSTALAVLTAPDTLTAVRPDQEAFGVRPRSMEQKFALHHLLNPQVGIVSLGGPAGTGKSFMALAAGLEQMLEHDTYKKVVVFRPLFAVGGQELGYLPGTAEEKMNPWAAAVHDALEAMGSPRAVEEILARGQLEVLPLTHLRGRSLTDTYVVVDEAQSLERPVLLTALSRMGANSKVVLSWDAAQRDNLRVGRHDGVAAVVERLKGEDLFAHVTFTKSERGPIAALVSRLMDDFGN